MSIENLAKHTYIDRAYNGANLGCITTGQGMVLIDTPCVPDEIRDWGEVVSKLSNKGIRYVINTHEHWDHILGNVTYCKDIIAHEAAYRELMKPDGSMRRYILARRGDISPAIKEEIYKIPIALPNITFKDRMYLHFGDVNIEIWHAGGHTDSSIYVHVVEDNILFTGDTFTSCHPWMGQTNFREWLKTLSATLKLDVDTFVPGHGTVSGKAEVKYMHTFVQQLWNRAKTLVHEGASRAEVVSKVHDLINFYPLNPGEEMIFEDDKSFGRLYDEITESRNHIFNSPKNTKKFEV